MRNGTRRATPYFNDKGEKTMPRTLLLALIVTALTAGNKSGASQGVAKAPDNVRKLPNSGDGEGHLNKARAADSVMTQ